MWLRSGWAAQNGTSPQDILENLTTLWRHLQVFANLALPTPSQIEYLMKVPIIALVTGHNDPDVLSHMPKQQGRLQSLGADTALGVKFEYTIAVPYAFTQ